MLFMHEVLTPASSRQNDLIDRVSWIHSYMQKHPGFLRGCISRYLGSSTEYLVFRWWQSPEDLADHGRNPEIPNWGANRPEGIYLVPPRTTRWELTSSEGAQTAGFFVRNIYRPASDVSGDLEKTVSAHLERAKSEQQVLGAEIYRSAQDTEELKGAVLSIVRFDDRDAYNTYLQGPLVVELDETADQRELLVSGCYEVVREALPHAPAK